MENVQLTRNLPQGGLATTHAAYVSDTPSTAASYVLRLHNPKLKMHSHRLYSTAGG
jgi:hypothetical protein